MLVYLYLQSWSKFIGILQELYSQSWSKFTGILQKLYTKKPHKKVLKSMIQKRVLKFDFLS